MDKKYLEAARNLYHPSKDVEALVLKLIDLFEKPLPNGVIITSLDFEEGHLKIEDLSVKRVENVNSHCGIEIHWYPNYDISTKSDPFCSAFVLEYDELITIYREVERALAEMQAK